MKLKGLIIGVLFGTVGGLLIWWWKSFMPVDRLTFALVISSSLLALVLFPVYSTFLIGLLLTIKPSWQLVDPHDPENVMEKLTAVIFSACLGVGGFLSAVTGGLIEGLVTFGVLVIGGAVFGLRQREQNFFLMLLGALLGGIVGGVVGGVTDGVGVFGAIVVGLLSAVTSIFIGLGEINPRVSNALGGKGIPQLIMGIVATTIMVATAILI
jgi:hypothetical protein